MILKYENFYGFFLPFKLKSSLELFFCYFQKKSSQMSFKLLYFRSEIIEMVTTNVIK